MRRTIVGLLTICSAAACGRGAQAQGARGEDTSAATAIARQAWVPSRCLADTTRVPVADTSTTDTIARGLTYRCMVRSAGPWLVHVVSVDLRGRRFVLEGARARGAMFGRERVSAIANRAATRGAAPLAAINADFFDLRTGEVENSHVIGGEWVKGVVATESPHDEFDNTHTQFAVDSGGAPRIGRFALDAEARTAVRGGERRWRVERVVGINTRAPETPGLVVYTPWYGSRTPHDTGARVVRRGPRDPDVAPPATTSRPNSAAADTRSAAPSTDSATSRAAPSIPELRADSARRAALRAMRDAEEIALIRSGRRGDTTLYRVADRRLTRGGNRVIPRTGVVLSATGAARAFVRALATSGGVVHLTAGLTGTPGAPRAAVGGWPRVVSDGANVGLHADSLEGTFPRFSSARHPRSAIGITRDSATLLLVVVDGRRPWSVGMSLAELGDELTALGAWQGMNLDGGGSSALWVRGRVVNYPSDATGERPVGNALLVLPPRAAR